MGNKMICPHCGSNETAFWKYDEINDKMIYMCDDCGELIIEECIDNLMFN